MTTASSVEVCGATIALVRQSRDMTQAQFAVAVGATQGYVSKVEASESTKLAMDDAARFADALGCVPALLEVSAQDEGGEWPCDFFRRRATTPMGQVKHARALLGVTQLHAQRLVDDGRTFPHLPPSADGVTNAEDIAAEVRRLIGLEPGPVDNVIASVESLGAVVVTAALPSRKVDALSHRPANGVPLIIVNDSVPGDRLRYTVSHETGHLVMHDGPTDQQEAEADLFATAFLMPANDIRHDFDQRLTLGRLAELKRKWRVSMAALLVRADQLNRIDARTYKSLNIELSKAGYRTSEPVAVATESPQRLRQTVQALLDRGDTIETIAAQALLPLNGLTDLIGGTP